MHQAWASFPCYIAQESSRSSLHTFANPTISNPVPCHHLELLCSDEPHHLPSFNSLRHCLSITLIWISNHIIILFLRYMW